MSTKPGVLMPWSVFINGWTSISEIKVVLLVTGKGNNSSSTDGGGRSNNNNVSVQLSSSQSGVFFYRI